MVRPSHDLSNVVVGGIRDYADQLAAEHDREVDAEEAHEKLLRQALVDVGILPDGMEMGVGRDDTPNGGDTT